MAQPTGEGACIFKGGGSLGQFSKVRILFAESESMRGTSWRGSEHLGLREGRLGGRGETMLLRWIYCIRGV